MLKPNVSYCRQENEVHYNPYVHDYSQDYLTFVAKKDGKFTFTPKNSNTISYSTDNGENWTVGNSVTVKSGDKVLWKGTMTPSAYEGSGTFSSTANFDVQGNVMSLLYGDNFKGQVDLTGKNNAFGQLFYQNSKVVSAENFSLPATTLAQNCYNGMFEECVSLTTAPELPATTLVNGCYSYMFFNCSSLNYIKAMFTTTPSTDYTDSWVGWITGTGTFVKNSAATWDVTGDNGIPTGWTVETASA